MSILLRIFLIVGSALSFWYIIYNIRKSRLVISDSIFWFFFAVMLLLNALFPQIAYFFVKMLGIMSPSNFVFLVIVALLILRVFQMNMRISQLHQKLNELEETDLTKEMEKK